MKRASTGATAPTDRTDWERVRNMSDANIQHDEDSPSTTAADWEGAVMRQGSQVVGTVRRRGAGKRPAKEQVAIRLDPEVLATFRADGPGWQTRINDALKEWVKGHKP